MLSKYVIRWNVIKKTCLFHEARDRYHMQKYVYYTHVCDDLFSATPTTKINEEEPDWNGFNYLLGILVPITLRTYALRAQTCREKIPNISELIEFHWVWTHTMGRILYSHEEFICFSCYLVLMNAATRPFLFNFSFFNLVFPVWGYLSYLTEILSFIRGNFDTDEKTRIMKALNPCRRKAKRFSRFRW
jgi:hypothetical protein